MWRIAKCCCAGAVGLSSFFWYMYDAPNYGTLWMAAHPTSAGVAYGEVAEWLTGATVTSCSKRRDSTWTCSLTRPHGYSAEMMWNPDHRLQYTAPTLLSHYRDLYEHVYSVEGAIGRPPVLFESALPW
jgi:hypothetical protein